MLKRGQTSGLVTPCVVRQEEQGQRQEECSDATKSVKGMSNDTDTCVGGTSVGNSEKAGWKTDSVQSVEIRKCYETGEKKGQFICENFQLDEIILNADEKLKKAVIKLFLENFEVLAMHPSQYGETEALEMKIDLVLRAIPYKSRLRPLNPDQKENLQNRIDEWLEQGVIRPSVSPWASPLVPMKKKDWQRGRVTDLRAEQTDSQGQVSPDKHTGDLTQVIQCFCLWSYYTVRIEPGSRVYAAFIITFGIFQYI